MHQVKSDALLFGVLALCTCECCCFSLRESVDAQKIESNAEVCEARRVCRRIDL